MSDFIRCLRKRKQIGYVTGAQLIVMEIQLTGKIKQQQQMCVCLASPLAFKVQLFMPGNLPFRCVFFVLCFPLPRRLVVPHLTC
jgi:hypothetical protein